MLERWDLLARWFLGRDLGPGPTLAWFWPRLSGAEPDVVLRLGTQLVLIEAKFRSGTSTKKGADPEDERIDPAIDEAAHLEPANPDQLVREWNSIQPSEVSLQRYPPALCAAIRECDPTLVYLVDERRMNRAEREVRSAVSEMNSACNLTIRTWQSLHQLLNREHQAHWVDMLRQFLESLGLCGFEGDWQSLLGTVIGTERAALSWRTSHGTAVRDRFAAVRRLEPFVKVVHAWRPFPNNERQ